MYVPSMDSSDPYAHLVASGRLTWEQVDEMKRARKSSIEKAGDENKHNSEKFSFKAFLSSCISFLN